MNASTETPTPAIDHTTGPCARCHQPTHRYGNGGNPLCPTCKQARQAMLAGTPTPETRP